MKRNTKEQIVKYNFNDLILSNTIESVYVIDFFEGSKHFYSFYLLDRTPAFAYGSDVYVEDIWRRLLVQDPQGKHHYYRKVIWIKNTY